MMGMIYADCKDINLHCNCTIFIEETFCFFCMILGTYLRYNKTNLDFYYMNRYLYPDQNKIFCYLIIYYTYLLYVNTIIILSCIKNKVIALYSYRGPALFLLTDNIDFPSFSPFSLCIVV